MRFRFPAQPNVHDTGTSAPNPLDERTNERRDTIRPSDAKGQTCQMRSTTRFVPPPSFLVLSPDIPRSFSSPCFFQVGECSRRNRSHQQVVLEERIRSAFAVLRSTAKPSRDDNHTLSISFTTQIQPTPSSQKSHSHPNLTVRTPE